VEYIKVQKAAALTDISVSELRKLIRRGDLPVTRIGRAVRLNAADLRAYLASHTSRTRQPKGQAE
jgi:excisionase family DNA binding protein